MSKVLRWMVRGMSGLGLGVRSANGDDRAEFEQVDGRRLHAEDFRSSASMRLDATTPIDFGDTLPAYNVVAPTVPRPHERRSQRAA